MNKMLRTLPVLALAGSLLLTACPAGGSSSGGSNPDFQLSRGFRTVEVTKPGTYGPVNLTAPAYTAQEFQIKVDTNAIGKYTIEINNPDGSVDAYACAGKPCSGFSSTGDWKDLSDDASKGIEVTVKGGNSDYFYAINRTRSPKAYSFVLVATGR